MADTKRCGICQRFFKPLLAHTKYCPKCQGTKKYYKTKPIMVKECEECGTQFETTRSNQRFCCDTCRSNWHCEKVLHNSICLFCGKEFSATKKFQKYCDSTHQYEAKKIREHKRYMEKKNEQNSHSQPS